MLVSIIVIVTLRTVTDVMRIVRNYGGRSQIDVNNRDCGILRTMTGEELSEAIHGD